MSYSQNYPELYRHWIMPLGGPWFLGLGALVLLFLVGWSVYWKGMAFWKAARDTDKVWFVVFLLVNTLGILEILYIYVFSKKKE